MVPGQRRAGEVVEAPGARLAPVALPVRLRIVAPVADHRVTAAPGTAHALRPAMLAHQREALGVVQQPREVDQVGCRHDRQGSLREGGSRSAAPIIKSEASCDGYPLPCPSTPRNPRRATGKSMFREQARKRLAKEARASMPMCCWKSSFRKTYTTLLRSGSVATAKAHGEPGRGADNTQSQFQHGNLVRILHGSAWVRVPEPQGANIQQGVVHRLQRTRRLLRQEHEGAAEPEAHAAAKLA